MTRRTAKVTMLPSQGLSAKLAKAVLPVLQENPGLIIPRQINARGQVVPIKKHND